MNQALNLPQPELLDDDTCSATIRHRGAVIHGTCLHYDDLSARIMAMGRVSEGTRVDLTLVPGDGLSRLEAAGVVRHAPPHPARGDRYEVLVELFTPPKLAGMAGEPEPEPRPEPKPRPAKADTGEYRVDRHVRSVSSLMQAVQRSALLHTSPERSSRPDVRAMTGAHLAPDPNQADALVAFIRYRRPETFLRVYEEEISQRTLELSVKTAHPSGTPVRLRFRLPRQTVTYAATVKIARKQDGTAEGRLRVRLDRLPPDMRRALETAFAMFAPGQAPPPPPRRFWIFKGSL